MKSIKFYDDHAKNYIKTTSKLDMSARYKLFEAYVKPSGHLLDLGCGSGRDSLHFLKKGYDLTLVDGSFEMVKHCQSIMTSPVYHRTFKTFETDERYDGIWASASLLHVERNDMVMVLQKYVNYLKKEGVFYASFKKYNGDYNHNNRYFTGFTEETLLEVIKSLKDVEILILNTTESIQLNNMEWVNVILKKL